MPAASKKSTQRNKVPQGAVRGSASTSRSSSKAPSKKSKKNAAPRKEKYLLPKPIGEANRSSTPGRPGYSVKEESLLTKRKFKLVKLTVERYVYKFLDVSKHCSQQTIDDKNKAVAAVSRLNSHHSCC
ncbi:hypothetical protein M408DRAFT_19124 [Serendipita vermifera MAFF 305830]|uniref:Uncharacterized protein n=1 Tax=Serendipita vermifera MAFF 305830 TaxID=933852 RepID=A0A0C2X809_SERVB|nr:hypothetical protein M408DRAFT_19124 [Serendipita vermifera MAFF 305830]